MFFPTAPKRSQSVRYTDNPGGLQKPPIFGEQSEEPPIIQRKTEQMNLPPRPSQSVEEIGYLNQLGLPIVNEKEEENTLGGKMEEEKVEKLDRSIRKKDKKGKGEKKKKEKPLAEKSPEPFEYNRSKSIIGDISDETSINLFRSKLKVLKKGLKEERGKCTDLEFKLKDQLQINKRFKEQLLEQENINGRLVNENSELQEQLFKLEKKTKSGGYSKMFKAKGVTKKDNEMEGELGRVRVENNQLRDTIEDLEQKFLAKDTVLRSFKANMDKQTEEKESTIRQMNICKDEYKEEVKKLQEQYKHIYQSNMQMMDEKVIYEETIESWSKEIENLKIERAKYHQESEWRKQGMADMADNIQRHERDNAELAEKLLAMKNQLIEYNSQNMLYYVMRIGPLVNTPAQLKFTRDQDAEFIFEIEKFGKKTRVYITEIEVRMHEKYNNRIIIEFIDKKDKNREIYESDQCEKIVRNFRDFRSYAISRDNSKPVKTIKRKKKELDVSLDTFLGINPQQKPHHRLNILYNKNPRSRATGYFYSC